MRHRFSRKDWLGDGVVMVVLGSAIAAAVFLPWANASSAHMMNFSLTKPDTINGALATPWGVPVLALAVVVIVVGIVMIAFRPSRLSVLPCLAVSLAGIAIALITMTAGVFVWDPMHPGIGLFIDIMGGVLLVPTGIASAMVAYILVTPGAFGGRARTAAFHEPVAGRSQDG